MEGKGLILSVCWKCLVLNYFFIFTYFGVKGACFCLLINSCSLLFFWFVYCTESICFCTSFPLTRRRVAKRWESQRWALHIEWKILGIKLLYLWHFRFQRDVKDDGLSKGGLKKACATPELSCFIPLSTAFGIPYEGSVVGFIFLPALLKVRSPVWHSLGHAPRGFWVHRLPGTCFWLCAQRLGNPAVISWQIPAAWWFLDAS